VKSCWVLINPDAKKNYLATPGNRYAALLSVDARASLSDVTDELAKLGFKVTYSWQSGQANRDSVFIDNWIARLPAPTKGTVWMYFELNYVGDVPKTIVSHIQKCKYLAFCGNVDIAYIFEAQQVPDNYAPCGPGDPQAGNCPPLAPPCAAPPPAPFPWKPALLGAAVGAVFAAAMAAMD
jgi:hypothetical protein